MLPRGREVRGGGRKTVGCSLVGTELMSQEQPSVALLSVSWFSRGSAGGPAAPGKEQVETGCLPPWPPHRPHSLHHSLSVAVCWKRTVSRCLGIPSLAPTCLSLWVQGHSGGRSRFILRSVSRCCFADQVVLSVLWLLFVPQAEAEDGVLLYCGENEHERGDFMSLAIIRRALQFR